MLCMHEAQIQSLHAQLNVVWRPLNTANSQKYHIAGSALDRVMGHCALQGKSNILYSLEPLHLTIHVTLEQFPTGECFFPQT